MLPASGVLLALICPQPAQHPRHQAQPWAAGALWVARRMTPAPLTCTLSPPSAEASCISIPILCSLKGSAKVVRSSRQEMLVQILDECAPGALPGRRLTRPSPACSEVGSFFSPILQVRKPRLGEVKWFAQGHRAR